MARARTSAAHVRGGSEDVSRPNAALRRTSDIAIARAVAEAVRAAPVVLDLSPGIVELAATYGPRERVTGVVVRHPNARDVTIEVHVVLRGSLHDGSRQHATRGGASQRGVSSRKASAVEAHTGLDGLLPRAADQIRRAVYRVAQGLDMPSLTEVDVLIDDIDDIQVPT